MRPGPFLRCVTALSTGALAAGCAEITATAPITVTISADSAAAAPPRSMADGDYRLVMVRLVDATGTGVHTERVTWSSSDTTRIAIRPVANCQDPPPLTTSAAYYACLGANGGGVAQITVHVGQGGFTTRDMTFSIVVNERWEDIATSANSTCAINHHGRLFCWGAGDLVGTGKETIVTTPTAVPTMQSLPVAQVFAGGGIGCVSARGVTVPYCWGLNITGTAGLGPSIYYSPFPTLPLGDSFSAVAPGTLFSCGIASKNRQVSCWGANVYWSLGVSFFPGFQGDEPCSYLGTLKWRCIYTAGIALLFGLNLAPANATNVAVGVLHACAATVASVQCWGNNAVGQLGRGVVSDSMLPNPDSAALVLARGDTAFVSTGDYHTCVAAGPASRGDRPTYCWGQNDNWQTGSTGCQTYGSNPFALLAGINCVNPAPIRLAADFATIVSGSAHSCGLSAAGVASCWGDNSEGMLGRGEPATRSATIAPVPLDSGRTFYKLASGRGHVCGITRLEGAIFCWGSNSKGQLGDGSLQNRPTPVRIREPNSILTTLGRLSR